MKYIFTSLYILILSLVASAQSHDACSTAEVITIGEQGMAKGVYTTTIVDIENATVDAEEFFPEILHDAELVSKSLWYTFHISSQRHVRIELKDVEGSMPSSSVGMAIYRDTSCTKINSTSLKNSDLGVLEKIGFTSNICVQSGTYFIQVVGNSTSKGKIAIELDVSSTKFNNSNTRPDFDDLETSYDVGLLYDRVESSDVELSCQSIDYTWETLPIAENKEQYTKSIWSSFKTGDHSDILGFNILNQNKLSLDEVYYILYSGNKNMVGSGNGAIVDHGLFQRQGISHYKQYLCNELNPNTEYHLCILFKDKAESGRVKLSMSSFGKADEHSAFPDLNEIAPQRKFVLTHTADDSEQTYSIQGYFNCHHTTDRDTCNSASQEIPTKDSRRYDLSSWAYIELERPVALRAKVTQMPSQALFQIYKVDAPYSCSSSSFFRPLMNLNDEYFETCLDEGIYLMRIVGATTFTKNQVNLLSNTSLGRTFRINLTINNRPEANKYNLKAQGRIDKAPDSWSKEGHQFDPDTLGCSRAVVLENEPSRRNIYRTFSTTESSLLRISDLAIHQDLQDTFLFSYKLYKEDLEKKAAEQSFPQDTLRGSFNDYTNDMLLARGGNKFIHTTSRNICIEPGTYSLVSMNSSMGRYDLPKIENIDNTHRYNSRVNAEKMDTLFFKKDTIDLSGPCHINPPNVQEVYKESPSLSEIDFYTCSFNPAIVGGLDPCFPDDKKVKQVYREFYIEEPVILSVYTGYSIKKPPVEQHRLYKGRASDLSTDLIPLVDCGKVLETACEGLEPGWYTIVTYGLSSNKEHSYLGDDIYHPGTVGGQSQLAIIPIDMKRAIHSTVDNPFVYDCDSTDYVTKEDTLYTGVKSYAPNKRIFLDCDYTLPPGLEDKCVESKTLGFGVFEITKKSSVRIHSDDSTSIMVFAGDCREDPNIFFSEPILPCVSAKTSLLELCELLPDTYTVVYLSKYLVISARIEVEKSERSKHDHAFHAYDFGVIPPDNKGYRGKVGDIHPEGVHVPASADDFFCSTGSSITDSIEFNCANQLIGVETPHTVHNPSILPKGSNFIVSQPLGISQQNLWYTFQLTGSGQAVLDITYTGGEVPRVEVYRSNSDGSLSFEALKELNQVDSLDLEFINHNHANQKNCYYPGSTISFEKEACSIPDTVRYYAVVTRWDERKNNERVSLEITYDGNHGASSDYDEKETAAEDFTDEDGKIHKVLSDPGRYLGPISSLLCSTRNSSDPAINSGLSPCHDRSNWYKMEFQGIGKLRFAVRDVEKNKTFVHPNFILYREIEVQGEKDLEPVYTSLVQNGDADNPDDHHWFEGCYNNGVYYLLWVDCSLDGVLKFDHINPYQPILWLLKDTGDYCNNAIPNQMSDIGSVTMEKMISCHTLGNDIGEDGSTLDCIGSSQDKRSSWFRLDIEGEDKYDLSLSLDLAGLNYFDGQSIQQQDIGFRVYTGDCSSMTPILCSPSGLTASSIECIGAGTYYIQVISETNVYGDVRIDVNLETTTKPDCEIPNYEIPLSFFDYTIECNSDSIYFTNNSTIGENIQYTWLWPDGSSTNKSNPRFGITRSDTLQLVEIVLITKDIISGLADTSTQIIQVEPRIQLFNSNEILLCNCQDTSIVLSDQFSDYSINGTPIGDTLTLDIEGLWEISAQYEDCPIVDSLYVRYDTCYTLHEDTIQICRGGTVNGIQIFRDTLLNVRDLIDSCKNVERFQDRIIVTPSPPLNLHNDPTFCSGDSVTVAVLGSYASYLWSDGSTTPATIVDSSDPISIQVTDGNGCQSVDTIYPTEINVEGQFLVTSNYNGEHLSCADAEDASVSLTASGGLEPVQFYWPDGSSDIVKDSLGAGTYFVRLEDSFGCQDSFMIEIKAPSKISAEIITQDPSCPGAIDGLIDVQGEGGTSPYTYIIGARAQEESLMDELAAGTYILSIKDENDCYLDTLVTLHGEPGYMVYVNPSDTTVDRGSIINVELFHDLDSISRITWSDEYPISCSNDDCTEIRIEASASGAYVITVYDENNCPTEVVINIRVSGSDRFILPNVFAPSGVNSVYYYKDYHTVDCFLDVKIYDTWGGLVYHNDRSDGSDCKEIKWDGIFKGQYVETGVYVMVLSTRFKDGSNVIIYQDITMIR